MRFNYEYYRTASVLIANGGSLSAAIDLEKYGIQRIYIPSSWTTANLTFQVSEDGTNFSNLYDSGGSEVVLTVAAGNAVSLASSHALAGSFRYLKIRSGTNGTPVNQGGDRTLTVAERPFH